MAKHQMREGDSVDETRAECSTYIFGEPTSIAWRAEHGGWPRQSPQDTATPYDKGGVAHGEPAVIAAGTRP